MPILSIMRDAGQSPSIVRITTTETLAEITAPEYLKTQIESIQRVNFGPFEWVDGDLVSIDYEDGEGFFAYDSVNQTFVQSGGGGSGANVNLSNLEAPTAVNQDILPDGPITRNIGAEGQEFDTLHTRFIRGTENILEIESWNLMTGNWEVQMQVLGGITAAVSFPKNVAAQYTPPVGNNSKIVANTEFVQQELSNYVPPAPPAPDWGDIGGTLSNQTDLNNALNSKADASSLGDYATLLCNLNAVVDPTAADDSGDGYDIGSRWINVNTNKEFVCVDDAVGGAVWEETTGGAPFDRYTYEGEDSGAYIDFPYGTNYGGRVRVGADDWLGGDDVNLSFPRYTAAYGGYGILLATTSALSSTTPGNNMYIPFMGSPTPTDNSASSITTMHRATQIVSPGSISSLVYFPTFSSSGKSATMLWTPVENDAKAGLVFIPSSRPAYVTIFVEASDPVAQAEVALYRVFSSDRPSNRLTDVSAPIALSSTGEIILQFDTTPVPQNRPSLDGFYWVVVRIIGSPTTLSINCCAGENLNLFRFTRAKEGLSQTCINYTGLSSLPSSLAGTAPASYSGIDETPYFVVHS